MIEFYKIINGYAPPITNNFFIIIENTHNLRNFQIILNKSKNKNKKTVRYCSETMSCRTPLLWVNFPEECKLANYLSKFKSRIKNRKCGTCDT